MINARQSTSHGPPLAVGGVEDTDVDLTANDEGSSPTVFFSFHSYYIYYFLK